MNREEYLKDAKTRDLIKENEGLKNELARGHRLQDLLDTKIRANEELIKLVKSLEERNKELEFLKGDMFVRFSNCEEERRRLEARVSVLEKEKNREREFAAVRSEVRIDILKKSEERISQLEKENFELRRQI